MAAAAASMSAWQPAATAACIAAPSAGPCSDSSRLRSRRVTSAYICIRNAFLSRPPATTSSSTGSPAPSKDSMILRVPKAVASSSAR